jgi:signal transduction histidine kinase
MKKLPFSKVDLGEITSKAVKKHFKKATEKNIIIEQQLQPAPVTGNNMSLEELIGILIDNAIKYTPAKGTIILRTGVKNRHTIFEIEDTGIGIKASDIPYIFNRFYRADTSRSKTTVPGGYGLGLAIAKSIIDLHEGTIHVKSVIGHGSTFSLRF